MSLSNYHEAMESLYRTCTEQASHRPTDRLFSQGLKYLLENCPAFDVCISEDNPFYKEFVLHLQTGVCMDEDCFSLFECLAIFFRIRQLLQKEREPSDTEDKILHYFETCGEWQPQDSTIVSHWYWWRIPTLAMH